MRRRKVTLVELQSLLGLLNFACKVIRPGRAFLRRLINLTCGLYEVIWSYMKFFYAGDQMLILLGMISCHINLLHEVLLCRGSDAHTARDDILPHQHVTWSSSMQGIRCSHCSGWYPATSTCYMKFFYAGDQMLILLGMISCHINLLHEVLLCRGSDAHTARDDILPHQHVTWSSSVQGIRCSYCSGWYPATSTCYMKFFYAGDKMLILLGMISCHINLLHEVLLCRGSDAHTARDDILSHQHVTWSSSVQGIRCSYC